LGAQCGKEGSAAEQHDRNKALYRRANRRHRTLPERRHGRIDRKDDQQERRGGENHPSSAPGSAGVEQDLESRCITNCTFNATERITVHFGRCGLVISIGRIKIFADGHSTCVYI
jgi:hypothetical protein